MKPLSNFGDPAHHCGDPPCSLCLHTYPEKEFLFCDQCKLKVHSMCWVFLRDVFRDLDEWPCVACQLPLDKSIDLVLRGSVPSTDEATAEMLTRRVFFARRAMNQARWAVVIGTPKNEAIEIALRAMYQDIPLEHIEQLQLSQLPISEQQIQASVPPPGYAPGEGDSNSTQILPSQTGQTHDDQSGQLDGVQQVLSSGHSVQPQPSRLSQTQRHITTSQQTVSFDNSFPTRSYTLPHFNTGIHSWQPRYPPPPSTRQVQKEASTEEEGPLQ